MSNLKPCPFCGEVEKLYSGACGVKYIDATEEHGELEITIYRVHCRTCGGRTKVFESPTEAVEAWNRRAEDNVDSNM